ERRISGTVVGYYERQRTTASHYSVQELHAMIKDGRRFGALEAQMDALTDAMHRIADTNGTLGRVPVDTVPVTASIAPGTNALDASSAPGPTVQVVHRRVEVLLRAAGLEGKPSIAYAASPT